MPRLTQTAQHGAHSGSTIDSGDDVQMEVVENSKGLPVSSTKKSKSTLTITKIPAKRGRKPKIESVNPTNHEEDSNIGDNDGLPLNKRRRVSFQETDRVCTESQELSTITTDANKTISLDFEAKFTQIQSQLREQQALLNSFFDSFACSSAMPLPNDNLSLSAPFPSSPIKPSFNHSLSIRNEITGLNKTLPKFKGGEEENFNSWVLLY